MSLLTDQIFFSALKSNASLMTTIGNRLYSTAIPLPDEDADNVPLPYVIVTFDGLTNDGQSKDNPYDGDYDSVNIGIEVAAEDRPSLGALTEEIRATISDYFLNSEDELVPLDYQFTAQAVQYDPLKPCFWQRLAYNCDTNI